MENEPEVSFLTSLRFKLALTFTPLLNILKKLSLIPRTWFPAMYIGNRVVEVGAEKENKDFPTNHVTNTKYTWFTFPLHNIAEQFFLSHMNRYFILVAVVQLWQKVSPVNPLTTWIPLIIVFCITALFAAVDDIRRVIGDKKVNNAHKRVLKYENGEWKEQTTSSKNIQVGDIVLVRNNEEIPADLVVLQSSGKDGLAFITTANLDGEIDLKARPVPKKLYEHQDGKRKAFEWLNGFEATITCPQPDPKIYSFNSSMHIKTDTDPIEVSLSAENLLLQSCKVKNTEWVIGLCVYNGNETKCGMNKRSVPSKRAQSDNMMDRVSWLVFGFQFLIFLSFGFVGTYYKEVARAKQVFYLHHKLYPDMVWTDYVDPIVIPVRFWLLTTYMIPISLKVTLDFMKMFYSLLIIFDRNMYDESDGATANARNTAIIEDLGQIEYILTDKTGTLTQNVMEFQRCSIMLERYGSLEKSAMDEDEIIDAIKNGTNENILNFAKILALCHTCSAEEDENGTLIYRSVSPDEEALCKAAARMGVVLFDSENETYQIRVAGKIEKYKVLRILKFNSDRKRMSVIFKDLQTNKIIIYSKGADDMMLTLVKREGEGVDELIKSTIEHLGNFSHFGLRTLVCGMREIEESEYKSWNAELEKALNIVGETRSEEVGKTYKKIEENVNLVGTTAIEDKLQQDVPKVIALLRQADIKIWMLTGDKFETAKQIGYSCNLCSMEEPLMEIVGKTQSEIGDSIQEAQERLKKVNGAYSLIIEGSTLRLAFEFFEKVFKEMCMGAKTVVCARVTPAQKASIVKLVKKQKKLTLAIGDGGNDVPMIQEAHVGVGLTGKEGLQASRAADFAFSQFRFLKPLLFVHGSYSLFRSGIIIQYCFYKNIVLAFLQVMFNVWTSFSGVSPYNDLSLSLYNTIFTIFVPVVFFDRFIDKEYLLDRPKLYLFSKKRRTWGWVSALLWFLSAILHAIVVLFVVSLAYFNQTTPAGSGCPDVQYLGIIMFTTLSWIVDMSFLMFSTSYNFINTVLVFLILCSYYLFIFLYNIARVFTVQKGLTWINFAFSDDSKIYFEIFEMIRDPNHYFAIILAFTIVFISVLSFKYFKMKIAPNQVEKFKMALDSTKKYEREGLLMNRDIELYEIGGGYKPGEMMENSMSIRPTVAQVKEEVVIEEEE